MNKIISKYLSISAIACAFTLASCNEYLDKLPDDRAEINSLEKVQKLLTTAYPDHTTNFLTEFSTDNVRDNGKSFTSQPNQDKVYRFEQVETTQNDDPKPVWEAHFAAIATANYALEGLAKLEDNDLAHALRAEALLCRAYSVFSLANCFCMAYDPEKADQYLGIPYPKVAGVSVDERGTLAETYANINADIEAALPLIDDSYLKVPAYHFNRRAAYAFAARFNLYYTNWSKAVKYATEALGENPTDNMRKNIYNYSNLGGIANIANEFIQTSEACNFLLVPKYSLMGRIFWSSNYKRYGHNRDVVTNETFWASMPWSNGSGSSNNALYESHLLYGSNEGIFTGSVYEFFEVTDKVNQTGYAHTVDIAFSGDETALVRAEANIHLKNYSEALIDMNNYCNIHCAAAYGTGKRPTLTEESVNMFWDSLKETKQDTIFNADETIKQINYPMGTKKPLHPQGFEIEEGTQTNMLYMILQMRRIETWGRGLRFQDIKRYGIEIYHNLDGESTIVFEPGDLRGAIQLPIDVIDAGLEKNPRK